MLKESSFFIDSETGGAGSGSFNSTNVGAGAATLNKAS